MSLTHPENWIWDFWFAIDPPHYHVFYLQAPRTLKDEALRHFNVSIGHAVSRDLQSWEILPDTLHPDTTSPTAWDNYTTWTGSILEYAGLWHLFYTGGKKDEHGLVQRIGLATSKDLIHWARYPDNPILVLDPEWYETLNLEHWHDQAWRDPWVFQHPESGDFHALITARVNHGPWDGRGVIAHAASTNLLDWEVRPPLTEPGLFGHMEVPQLVEHNQVWYLLFSTPASCFSRLAREQGKPAPQTGTYYLTSSSPLGPFTERPPLPLLADKTGSFYSGKLIRTLDGEWKYMAVQMSQANGSFAGTLSDPYAVILENHRITVSSVPTKII